MNVRVGMNELMRQAARLQRKIEETKKEFATREVVADAAGGRVKVTATLGRTLHRIEVDKEFLESEGLEMALDAVCAAANAALENAQKSMEAELEKVTGGVKVPGVV
jgi:DNA-binding YbaB/EbfC family protein